MNHFAGCIVVVDEDKPPMPELDEITAAIVDTAVRIHKDLGPGLLESVYETVLARSLDRRGLRVSRQPYGSFDFDGMEFVNALRVDLLVEGQVIVEVKSVEHVAPVHTKQVLTYLRLMKLRVGLLLNFGASTMKEGVQRIVNGLEPSHSPALRVNNAIPDVALTSRFTIPTSDG